MKVSKVFIPKKIVFQRFLLKVLQEKLYRQREDEANSVWNFINSETSKNFEEDLKTKKSLSFCDISKNKIVVYFQNSEGVDNADHATKIFNSEIQAVFPYLKGKNIRLIISEKIVEETTLNTFLGGRVLDRDSSGNIFFREPLQKIFFASEHPLTTLWDGLLANIVAGKRGAIVVPPELPDKLQDFAKNWLLQADNQRARLPTLEERFLHDLHLGHWDLYWPAEESDFHDLYHPIELHETLVARDPIGDIQCHVPVAIDFGTTSTVVALREQGRSRLLRIGVKNWHDVPSPKDFENPTVLEMLDYKNFVDAWRCLPYRPDIQWKHVKCSHWAKAELSHEASCTTIQSGITNLKTWTRSDISQHPIPRQDQLGHAFTLDKPSVVCRNPKSDFSKTTFDPLELYAYFIGLYINNQHTHGGRIYHEYYMSFPVKFDKATRERIMASFARGLERSLPATLGLRDDWRKQTPFTLTEGASEPAAYAAAVLPHMGLEPSLDGLPFGVFDLGGGTTDFAIGLYRLPTPKEEHDQGWDQVLDMLDSAGDENLGGEHLLHHIAYTVVHQNAQKLLSTGAGLPFVMPVDATPFPGAELLLDYSLVARTNTTKLCEALRPLWEENALETDATGQISLTLYDRNGDESPMLMLDVDETILHELLRQRILQGVEAFFTTFRQALKVHQINPGEFHILLAGNACRSLLVLEAFEKMRQRILENAETSSVIVIHEPLLCNEKNLFSPTLKTGVALGLLRTVPGESTGIIERAHARNNETPFLYTMGTFKKEKLVPILSRFGTYGQWKALGVVRSDLTLLIGYSDSPLALEGDMTREQCAEKRLTWQADDAGKQVMVRAVSKDSVELGLVEGIDGENVLPTAVCRLQLGV